MIFNLKRTNRLYQNIKKTFYTISSCMVPLWYQKCRQSKISMNSGRHCLRHSVRNDYFDKSNV